MRFGIEFEMFTLDEAGYMVNGADRLIQRVKKMYPEVDIKRECGKNMVEIITSPNVEVPGAMLAAIENFEKVLSCAQQEKTILYAYGTYPGVFTPEFHSERRYRAQEKIFGKQRFAIGGRCVGLHIHYSLPWGVYDSIKKILKPLLNSKNADCLVHIYNLCIAMDPALTAFTQSSPLYQGKYIGKDSRVIVYRGGKELNYPDGLYANHPEFGALQEYKPTHSDIIHVIGERFENWTQITKMMGYDIYTLAKHGSVLDSTWNPVKINAHGTMEIRGMDMNHPDVVVAIAILIRFILKEVQEKFIAAKPCDAGKIAPFGFEKNTILIPPSSHVRSRLQRLSAYEGLGNDEVHAYCSALLRLASQFIPKEKRHFLEPLDAMLASRQTASDRILRAVDAQGWDRDRITPAQAASLARELSIDLYSEIATMKERLTEFLKKG